MTALKTALKISLLVAAVSAWILLVPEHLNAAAKIKLSESNYSFGKITQHKIMTKRFWIKSVGDKPARITEALQDCACTNIYLTDSLIKPGDSVPLDISLNSRSFIGFVNKRSHYLVEGSPDTTYLMLYAEVLIKPEDYKPISLAPLPVDVSQFSEKPRRKGVFTLTNNGPDTYKIIVVDSTHKSFDVQVPAEIKPGQKIEGVVIVKKGKIKTSFDESFAIEFTDDGRTRLSIPVSRVYSISQGAVGATR
ncbi:MAG: DUF1573 domain-containing protein [Candidatus Zixiibacteriota bacterium]